MWGAYANAGYNPRGSPYSFDSVEAREISLIWARVAEDFAPFDVDVTTEEPAIFGTRTVHCLIADRLDLSGNTWAQGASQGAGTLEAGCAAAGAGH